MSMHSMKVKMRNMSEGLSAYPDELSFQATCGPCQWQGAWRFDRDTAEHDSEWHSEGRCPQRSARNSEGFAPGCGLVDFHDVTAGHIDEHGPDCYHAWWVVLTGIGLAKRHPACAYAIATIERRECPERDDESLRDIHAVVQEHGSWLIEHTDYFYSFMGELGLVPPGSLPPPIRRVARRLDT